MRKLYITNCEVIFQKGAINICTNDCTKFIFKLSNKYVQ